MRFPQRIIAIAAMAALPLVGCAGTDDTTVLQDLIGAVSPPTPTEAAMDLFDVYDADKRRRAVALISASPFGGEPPYVQSYRLLLGQTAEGQTIAPDADPTVRAAALAALGRHGQVSDAMLIVQYLNDESAFVRWQAAKALQKIHDPAVVTALMDAMADDEDGDVRQASAAALGQYPQPRVFDALIGALSDVNFGVVEAARDSLRQLTGKAFAQDPKVWMSWADDHRGELFQQQQPYGYEPYRKPPSLLDKARFWRETPPVEAIAPVGLGEHETPPAS